MGAEDPEPRAQTSRLDLKLRPSSSHNQRARDSSLVRIQPFGPGLTRRLLPLGIRNVTAARMRLPVSISVPPFRSAILAGCHPPIAPLIVQRSYASAGGSGPSSAAAKRRAVTPFNDNGQVPWSDLSVAEKSARAAQQTFNMGFIVVGVVLTVGNPGALDSVAREQC